jgi:hypothetical protein
MKNVHYHTSKEKKLWRAWLNYRKFRTHLEISTARTGPGFKLHLGNRSSETPIDWNVCLYWINFYGSFDWPGLGAFCSWLGRGHKRDISLHLYSRTLWWKVWYDDDMGYDDYHDHDKWKQPVLPPWRWGRHKYRSWMCLRDGNIDINPVDAFWGSRKFVYTDIETFTDTVGVNAYPRDMQLVTFTLQSCVRQRDHGPAWARRPKWVGYSVAWRCEEGIPTQNHDWKGDCVYASSVAARDPIDMDFWRRDAMIELVRWIKKDRARNGYYHPCI